MPFVHIQLYENELANGQEADLIANVTDAVCKSTREELRPAVWVVVDGVKASRWGIAGKAGSDD